MKKILIIQGDGRPKGNTRQLVDTFAQGAMEAGHEVEIVSLNKIQVNGCLGCNACRYGKPCIQKDGFNELVPKIKEADCIGLCLATAVLDDLVQAESVRGAVLLHCGGGPKPAAGQV